MHLNDETLRCIRECSRDDAAYEKLLSVVEALQHDQESLQNEKSHQIEEQLRRSEANLRAMLNSTWQSFTLIDRDCRVMEADEKGKLASEAIFGKRIMPGDLIYDFVLERDHDSFTENFGRSLAGETIVLEKLFPTQDGSTLYFEIAYFPVTDNTGTIIGVCMSHQNITERKSLELGLRRYENMIASSTDAISLLNLDYEYLTINQTYEHLFELPGDQIVGMRVLDLVGESTYLEIIKPNLDRCRAGEMVNYTDWIESPAMGRRLYDLNLQPLLEESGEITGIITNIRDVTEKRRVEEALRESEERLSSIVNNIPVMIGSANKDGRFDFVNKHWVDQLGWTLEEMTEYDDPMALFYPDPDEYEAVTSYIRSGATAWKNFHPVTKDRRKLITAWANIHLSDGSTIGIGQEISDQLRARQREIDLALEKERVQLLSRFIRTAAHEFRTPLATINSSAYLMHRLDTIEARQIKLTQIESSIERVTQLLDKLLLMVRIESSPPETVSTFEVVPLLEAVCDEVTNRFADRPPTDYAGVPRLPTVKGEADSFADAIRQLLDNAYRHTSDETQVTVYAGIASNRVWIEVRDDGQGISLNELPHVFETFWRQDSAHTSPGLGLGLPIAKKIVEHHRGDIHIDSAIGQGTVIRITLPFERPD